MKTIKTHSVFVKNTTKTLCFDILVHFGVLNGIYQRKYIPPPRVGGSIWKSPDLSLGDPEFLAAFEYLTQKMFASGGDTSRVV